MNHRNSPMSVAALSAVLLTPFVGCVGSSGSGGGFATNALAVDAGTADIEQATDARPAASTDAAPTSDSSQTTDAIAVSDSATTDATKTADATGTKDVTALQDISAQEDAGTGPEVGASADAEASADINGHVDTAISGDAASSTDSNNAPIATSAGCGKPATHKAGGVQVSFDAGADGDGKRGFYLVLPKSYDPNKPHRLIIGYPGTNWKGVQIRGYLKLEDGASNEIFVYPDPLWRKFKGWGTYGGWVLGPYAAPANGNGDLVFTSKLIDYLQANYCVDKKRVFATGHSWGGDMAAVVGCFLGDRIRAAAPVAANRPYWFEKSYKSSWVKCVGKAAVWIHFGLGDTHFTQQSYPGEYGNEVRDFFVKERACTGKNASDDLGIGAKGECVAYKGCSSQVRYCLYGKAAKHGKPSYYSKVTRQWFRSF